MDKVVSGGQTGVDRAALDAAMAAGIAVGGWCPRGRLAEDGVIPARYQLRETPSSDYAVRTECNVRDSDATLVLSWGAPTGGTALTIAMADKHAKPWHLLDMLVPDLSAARAWLAEGRFAVLNVAGPRASAGSHIAAQATAALNALLSPAS